MQTVGIDTGVFKRPSDISPFHALMGVAVTVRDRERFRRTYDEIIDDFLRRLGTERKKRIYKAAHVTGQLLHNTTPFLRYFIEVISPELMRIDVFYTYYPEGTVDYILTCRNSYRRRYLPKKFMDLIQKSYEHYCVWKYCDAYPDCRHYLFEVDHFQGKISPAWDNIENLENLRIFYSGDECNKAISTSDLILRHIYNTNPGRLRLSNLKRCFGDIINGTHLRDHFLGPRRDYLNMMAFRDYIDIDIRPYIKHPIYWIVWEKYTNRAEEKKTFEWDPKYNEIMEKAEEHEGCVRFWDAGEFTHIVNEYVDIACLINDEALPILKSMQTIAPNIRVWDLRSRD